MNINYIRSFQRWSKRLPQRFTTNQLSPVTPAHLPRLLCQDKQLPNFVRDCPTTMSIIPRYRLLAWEKMAQPSRYQWFGKQPTPLTAYVGAFLLKIDQKLGTISHLRRFLQHHPALIWALGFPLEGDSPRRHRFDADLSLPTRQQLGRMLREVDNSCLQILLTEQVTQLQSKVTPKVKTTDR